MKVTSPVAAQAFYNKLSAKDKHSVIYPVLAFQKFALHPGSTNILSQDARHELHNEPDGVREKSLNEIVEFIRGHIAK